MTNDSSLFDALGFRWDRSVLPKNIPTYSVERATANYNQALARFVYDAGALENNPLTFLEVKTVLDGVTVGGRKISDQEQIINLADSSKRLIAMVREGVFDIDKKTFTELHGIVARNEALEWGIFRGEGKETTTRNVDLDGRGAVDIPLPTIAGAPDLNHVFIEGAAALKELVQSPIERGAAFFLFGAYQQFFFDGNKRTSRHMMNGILMSSGLTAISIPAARALEFNTKMAQFYPSRDASDMMDFLVDCHFAALEKPASTLSAATPS